MKKIKNKKTLIIILVLLLGVVGITIAYFSNSSIFDNIFNTKAYGTTYTEEFVSPDNWLPGDTTEKNVIATNSGSVDQAVRIKISEKWLSYNNQELSLDKDGVTAALINLDNSREWIKDGNYYYYKYKIAPNESTSSFIKSVTFNPDITLDNTCTETQTSTGKKVTCSSSGNDYDNAKYTLTFNIETVQYNQYKKAWNTNVVIEPDRNNLLYEFVANNGEKYTGNGSEDYEHDVYFLGDNDKNNVLFANKCWKIVRTTETGGVKILYNGEPIDGKCNNSGDDTTIGEEEFNTHYNSPAYVGYMYNKVYESKEGETTSDSLYGSDVTYDGTNYTLTNTSTTKDSNHHYTCNNTSGTCSTVRYYYYNYDHNNYYIELDGTDNIQSALNEMLSDDNVNSTNSTIKTTIDNWYEENMTDYEEYLEDTVFCNDRSISSLAGWNPNGGSLSDDLKFKEYNVSSDLTCSNETDKFTVSRENGNGALTYPVGLLSSPEANLWGETARTTDRLWWLGSPVSFYYSDDGARGRDVFYDGSLSDSMVGLDTYYGVRPAVSLAPATKYASGDGTVNSPFIIPTE